MPQLQHIICCQNQLGEGPLWHAAEQALYWVDIELHQIHRYFPATKDHTSTQFSLAVTALGIRKSGGFIAATAKGFGGWDGVSNEIALFSDPESHLPNNRFNDGAVGPSGRFWAGTMYAGAQTDTPDPGVLYRLDHNRSVRVIEPGLTISNGLGWSPNGTRFYHTDTLRHTIYVYDFDPSTGEAGNRQVFVHDPEQPGVPDGLTVDNQGFVWIVRWGGWKVTRYDPDGTPEREIILPVECPTSCTFGGAELNQLYITSAWTALNPEQRAAQPQAGDLFQMEFKDISGLPPHQFLG